MATERALTLIDARDIVTQPNGWTKCDPIGHSIHHSVTEVRANATIEDERNHIRKIDAYHVLQEFGGFGYHTATFPSGRSYLTGNWKRARAHVMHRNHELVGSVAIGNFSASQAPPLIIAGLAECVAEARQVFGRELPINGHGQWAVASAPSSCPGLIRTQIDAIIAALQEDDMDADQDSRLKRVEGMLMRLDSITGWWLSKDPSNPGAPNLITADHYRVNALLEQVRRPDQSISLKETIREVVAEELAKE